MTVKAWQQFVGSGALLCNVAIRQGWRKADGEEAVEFQTGNYSVAVNVPDWASLAYAVSERMAARDGYALATLNMDHLEKLSVPGLFRDAYAAQDFVTADGNPIVWCAALAGRSVDLLPGSDLILPLCRLAVENGIKLGLVGSTSDSLEGAAQALRQAVPDWKSPPASPRPWGSIPTKGPHGRS